MNLVAKLCIAVLLATNCLTSMYANDIYTSKHYTESMKKYLISAQDALELMKKEGVKFVSGDDKDTFEGVGHIVGSVNIAAHYLNHTDITGKMACPPLFMCPKEAQEYISSKGISNDDLVIAYDNFRGPNATGVWAFFKLYGHEKVMILNGGMDAIKAIDPAVIQSQKYKKEALKYKKIYKKAQKEEGKKSQAYKDAIGQYEKFKTLSLQALEKSFVQKGKEVVSQTTQYVIDTNKIDLNLVASKQNVLEGVYDIQISGNSSKYAIIDTRGMEEIIGIDKKNNVARGGHIPGAKFIEWKNFTDFSNKLSYKTLQELQAIADKYGLKKDQEIYTYCHVGTSRSSHVAIGLKILGYENVKIYTGSWDEWGNDMNLPIYK
ncbi:MAG: sulfurtransferase [Campylobacterales bacterium]|nr:sulfurtransferase [Campylobacterales bacterium]